MSLNLTQFYLNLFVLVAIISIGFFLGRRKILTSTTVKQFSNLLLNLFMPAALFTAFPKTSSASDFNLFLLGLFAGILVMGLMIISSLILFTNRHYQGILRYQSQFAFIFNNAAFLGYPLISTTFGTSGLIPYSGFIIAFNFALFSYGVFLFTRRLTPKFFKDLLFNPNLIATILGFIFFVLNFHLPKSLLSFVEYLALPTTPLSLITIGVMLSATNLLKLLRKLPLFFTALIQLTLAPISTWALLSFLSFPQEIILICTLLQSLPTATILGLFADQYGGRKLEATELIAISTTLSLFTLPIIASLLFA